MRKSSARRIVSFLADFMLAYWSVSSVVALVRNDVQMMTYVALTVGWVGVAMNLSLANKLHDEKILDE